MSSVSLEAFAMAGMEYSGEWGIDVEKWESQDLDYCPPPYLLAEGRVNDNDNKDKASDQQRPSLSEPPSQACRS
ncbi:prostatic spermine-binding protein [Cucumis melo var. makuwa]|uniref:Prostatic spermine-binding protein n=2 Tax=Cucumis melo TaxID=3656 RepID=A0A5D3CMY4_CUCMM|nr:prostatic spermine-binding protein [Cucumis melo var. makuwa]TYK12702.1 prostatic spermine-binding protein [Cucumis melo var. makuwa]